MMEAVSVSETSVSFYETTRRNIPEDSLIPSVPDRVHEAGGRAAVRSHPLLQE
jgi:hypothetical protein